MRNDKCYIIVLSLLCCAYVANAQVVEQDIEVDVSNLQISVVNVVGHDEGGVDIKELREHKVVVEEDPTERPFVGVEQMPYFNGGDSIMREFIKQNLKFPELAKEQGIQGRVVVRFVVNKLGKIVNAQVIRGIDPACDREALRVIKVMPDWRPGKQNGRNVSCYFTLPIIFRLPVEEPVTTIDNKEEKNKDRK